MPQVSNSPAAAPTAASPSSFSDLGKAPAELQAYIADLAKLGVFPGKSGEFKPSAEISRREYVRWLVEANNLIHSSSARPQNSSGCGHRQTRLSGYF